MKQFIAKTVLFLIGLLIIVMGIMLLSTASPIFNRAFAFISCSEEYTTEEEDVKTGTLLSTKKYDDGYTKLIVGDSVCYMLFTRLQEKNSTYLIAGSSRPFTVAGQYTLIKEFLDHHPEATEVDMFMSLASWEAVIDVQCGYQQLMVPLVRSDSYKELDKQTQIEASQMYSSLLLKPEMVSIYHDSLMNHKIILNSLMTYHEKIKGEDLSKPYESTPGEMSPLSVLYLNKIIQLCEEREVQLNLLHDSLADTKENHASVEIEKETFQKNGFYDMFPEYFDSVIYYSPDNFFDGVHFNVEDSLNNEVINNLKKQTGLLQELVVE